MINRMSRRYIFSALINALVELLVIINCGQSIASETIHDYVRSIINPKTSASIWQGTYLGVNLGSSIPLNTNERLSATSGFGSPIYDLYPTANSYTGITGGVQAGYNWQNDNIIYGVETDFNYQDGRNSTSGLFIAPTSYWNMGIGFYNLSSHQNAKYFGSLRSRLGLSTAVGLLYFTAGVAVGGTKGPRTLQFGNDQTLPPFSADYSRSERMKYILGGGIEQKLDGNKSIKFEYLYLNQSTDHQIFENDNQYQYQSNYRTESQIVRIGFNQSLENKVSDDNALSDKLSGAEITDTPKYTINGLSTGVVQGYPKFRALYDGPKSLPHNSKTRFGSASDVFMGIRLWEGAAAYVDPEIRQGYSIDNGVGESASSDAVVFADRSAPYLRFQRYYIRQVIGLGSNEKESSNNDGTVSQRLDDSEDELTGLVDKNRITITAGKYSIVDIFDANEYAHDPTRDFLNNSFNSLASFDFGGDSWGYSNGITAEWKQNWWSARTGIFQMPLSPGSDVIDPTFLRQYTGLSEVEARYELFGQPGKIKFLGFLDHGYMAKFDEVVDLSIATHIYPPDLNLLRKKRTKTGAAISLSQQIMPNLGWFVRAGLNNCRYESIDQSDVDQEISSGVVFSGSAWDRQNDEIGFALGFSAISPQQLRYLKLGGETHGIGDGKLNYQVNETLESYYRFAVVDWLEVSLDHQLIVNPSYNSDRGPINIFGLRVRTEF